MPPRKTRNSQSTEYARINRPGQPLFPHHPDPPAPAPDPPVPDPPPDPPPVAALWAPPDDPQDRLCQCIHHARAYRCRCINAITKEDYGYGYRLCSECRASPQQILDRTDQQTIALVNMIEDRGLQFRPECPVVSNNRSLSPKEQALDTTVANTPTSASFPPIWGVIIDRLFAYRPGNGWVLSFNPHEQSLEGEAARTFLYCRSTCTAFDHHMLGYMARFTMKPVRYGSGLCEVEFEQRELVVYAARAASVLNEILYCEYRVYSREVLRVNRGMVRANQVHDSRPRLHQDDPEVQFWVEQATAAKAGPTSRQTSPWFLPRDDVGKFHEQCRLTTWTQAEHEANAEEEEEYRQLMNANSAQHMAPGSCNTGDCRAAQTADCEAM